MTWDSESLLVLLGPGQPMSDREYEEIASLLNIPDEALPVSKSDPIFGEVLDDQVLAEWKRSSERRFENDAAKRLDKTVFGSFVRKLLENPKFEGNPTKKETPEVARLQEFKFGSGERI